MKRVVLYPKDLQILTGKGPKACSRLFNKMKKHYGKTKEQLITVEECGLFLGLKVELIMSVIRG